MTVIERMADFFSGCYLKAVKNTDTKLPLWERFALEVDAADKNQYPTLPKFHKTRGTKERNTKVLVSKPGMMRTVDVMQFFNLSEEQVRWAKKKHLLPEPALGGGAGHNLYWREIDIKSVPMWHVTRIKAGYFKGNTRYDGLPTYESVLEAEREEAQGTIFDKRSALTHDAATA